MARGLRGSFQGRGLPQSLRRKTSWEEGPAALAAGTLAQTATGSIIIGAGAQIVEDGLTLVRMRGSITPFLSSVGGAGDGFFGSLGVGIVTAEAFAVGITAVPTPQTDIDWDGWLWHGQFNMLSNSATLSPAFGLNAVRFEIDSKAMRKLNLGDTIFWAAEVTEVGVSQINYRGDSRLLLKLP